MQFINMLMIYYWDKKLKKRLHVLEADMIKSKTLIRCLKLKGYFMLQDVLCLSQK